MEKAEYKRFLIVSTDRGGACSVLFSCDNQEQAEEAYLAALDSYADDRKSGAISVDLYKIF